MCYLLCVMCYVFGYMDRVHNDNNIPMKNSYYQYMKQTNLSAQ